MVVEREAQGTIDKIEEEQHTGRPGPCVWINGHGGLCQRGRKDDAAQQIINCNEKSPKLQISAALGQSGCRAAAII